MLAGMINAPTQDDPLHDLKAARERAATVIDAMVANGKLSPESALVAKLNPALPDPAETVSLSTGWFADWIYNKALAATPAISGTVVVRTTLDPRLQQAAIDIVRATLAQYGAAKHVSEAALVAMRPDGAVVAMVGGRSYAESQYNRAVQAKRQPGSAFKLFDYYAAFRQGYSPDDRILDDPVNVKGWRPENYGRRYHGEVTLAEAFADSLNAATVRLSQQVGIGRIIAAARDLGLHASLPDLPSIALGTADMSLIDLTSAYAAVRAGVAPVEPWGIAAIRSGNDNREVPVGAANEAQHRLGSYQQKLIDLLQGVVEHGTGRAAALDGFAAGKTGTAQDYRDAWFIGFNDALVVGVWVGNDDHSPMDRVVGGTIPAMIWKRFMEKAGASATAAQQEPQTPSGLFDQSGEPATPPTPRAQCNLSICEQQYQSFRALDCTYQPYSGQRQYCER
jgi:membrane peptidoglycan carboxypeptidase